jgi:hypothetical protein
VSPGWAHTGRSLHAPGGRCPRFGGTRRTGIGVAPRGSPSWRRWVLRSHETALSSQPPAGLPPHSIPRGGCHKSQVATCPSRAAGPFVPVTRVRRPGSKSDLAARMVTAGHGRRRRIAMARQPVIAATDGSQESMRAVVWAAREATLREATLRIVAIAVLPQRMIPSPATPEAVAGMVERSMRRALAAAPRKLRRWSRIWPSRHNCWTGRPPRSWWGQRQRRRCWCWAPAGPGDSAP